MSFNISLGYNHKRPPVLFRTKLLYVHIERIKTLPLAAKVLTVLVVIMLKLQPMTSYFTATLYTAVIDWIWQMAGHQQTTNHISVVQYDTIFFSDHSIPWQTEKPSPPSLLFAMLHISLYISLYTFYIALPLIFQHSEKLKANTFHKKVIPWKFGCYWADLETLQTLFKIYHHCTLFWASSFNSTPSYTPSVETTFYESAITRVVSFFQVL